MNVRLWPDSAVSIIRRARQLSGDKLPSLGRRLTAEDDPKLSFVRPPSCKRKSNNCWLVTYSIAS